MFQEHRQNVRLPAGRESEHPSDSDKLDQFTGYELDSEHNVIQVSHFVRMKKEFTKN